MDISTLTNPGKEGNPVAPWAEGFYSDGEASKWYRAAVYEAKERGGLGIKNRSLITLVSYCVLQITRLGKRIEAMDSESGAGAVRACVEEIGNLREKNAGLEAQIAQLDARIKEVASVDLISASLQRGRGKKADKSVRIKNVTAAAREELAANKAAKSAKKGG